MKKCIMLLVFTGLLLLASSALAINPMLTRQAAGSKEAPTDKAISLPENLQPAEVDAIVSRLSDDQVRRLLIDQLQAEALAAATDTAPQANGPGRVIRWFEDRIALLVGRSYGLFTALPAIPGDVRRAVEQLTDYQGVGRFGWMTVVVLGFLVIGYGAEMLFGRLTSTLRKQIETMPGMGGLLKFWGAVIHIVPDLLGILVFTLAPLILFFMTVSREDTGLRLLFLAFLLTVVTLRLFSALLRFVLSLDTAKLRLVPMTDETAGYLYRRLMLVAGILVAGMIATMLFQRLGTPPASLKWWMIFYGSTIILIFAGMIWRHRHRVRGLLMQREVDESETSHWLRRQFADMWHVLALTYLFLVWLLAMVNLVTADAIRFRGTFIVSFLIVPIYLALDRLAVWCFESTVAKSVEERLAAAGGETPSAEGGETDKAPAERSYMVIARRVVRLVVFAAVALWFLDLWGFRVPIGEAAVEAIFNILVTLLVAHIVWELVSAAISRKLAQGGFVEAAEKEEEDDEWSAGAPQDRSHTLLPMLRKFLGVVMVVMTTLIVLSAIGVDIGPLLAGAGVIGLAIGFGAQKLVRDILSGIFFLMDDAFRVGEYLDAGGVSGTVEEITLRTIKLRHHRGMLQIVPLGDLKSITNFMRGGMVVKFDLQLPYDTDIEKVRKIIKKVGKAMLLDEKLGPDFIKPVKSQGVNKVGDSVMTFRVKFTARPGTHFVIRREAFRRITEALEKKGIHYAHRKVIVDLSPELAEKMDVGVTSTTRAGESSSEKLTPEQKKQVLTAGAAAALDTIVEQEEEDDSDGKKKKG